MFFYDAFAEEDSPDNSGEYDNYIIIAKVAIRGVWIIDFLLWS
jgi:hypothetical protein